jgi:hypothetical protein
MADSLPPYCSFLVRFWYEPNDDRWHGEVEHIQSRRRTAVRSLDEVQAALALLGDSLPPILRHDAQPDKQP